MDVAFVFRAFAKLSQIYANLKLFAYAMAVNYSANGERAPLGPVSSFFVIPPYIFAKVTQTLCFLCFGHSQFQHFRKFMQI